MSEIEIDAEVLNHLTEAERATLAEVVTAYDGQPSIACALSGDVGVDCSM